MSVPGRRATLRASLPWLCGLIAAGMALRNLWSAPGDLGIYLEAARELGAGGHDLYRQRATPPYPYPHVFLLPLRGLQILLPDRGIVILWSLGLGLATSLLLADLSRAMRAFGGLSAAQWALFGFLFQRTIAQNLTHGQASLWVAALMLRATLALMESRQRSSGLMLGTAAAIKLTPSAYLAALPLMRAGRAALWTLLALCGLVFLLPWPFLGEEHWRHLADFHRAMIAPLFDGSLKFAVRDHQGPGIAGTLDYLLQKRPIGDDGRVIAVLDLGDEALSVAKLVYSAAIALLLWAGFASAHRLDGGRRIPSQSAIVMLAIAFFSPHANVYHLAGAALPFAMFCLGALGPAPGVRRGLLWWTAAIGFACSLTLRQKKLVGETLWRGLSDYGVLHVSLVLLTLWLVSWIRGAAAKSGTPLPAAS
ncbi:MAG: hypothetical protein Fur0037_04320 [Planctomycetota bacterium]